jgi:hypothetical protein
MHVSDNPYTFYTSYRVVAHSPSSRVRRMLDWVRLWASVSLADDSVACDTPTTRP